jgi:DNA repair exonuclease SbcCD ATPase subunit
MIDKRRAAHIVKLLALEKVSVFSKMSHAMMILKTSTMALAAQLAEAKGVQVVTAKYYLKALAIKAAAGATYTLGGALSVIAAHPVMTAIIALVASLKLLDWAFSRASKKAQEYSKKAKEASEASAARTSKGDKKRQDATFALTRLKELQKVSQTSKLSADEIKEAVDLINTLRPFGSDEWANIDKVTGKINLASDAMSRLQKSMREAAIADLQSELKSLEAEEKAIKNENKEQLSWKNFTNLAALTGKDEKAVERIKENASRLESVTLKRIALEKRLAALRGGDKNAVTGKEITAQERANINREKRNLSEKEYQKILSDIEKLEEDIERKKRSRFENEIHDIKKVRDEYQKNIDKLIEQNKLELENNIAKRNIIAITKGWTNPEYSKLAEKEVLLQKQILELEKRKTSANAAYQKQLDDAKKEEQKRIAESRKNYEDFTSKFTEQEKVKDKREEQDRAIEGLLKNNAFDEALKVLNKFATAEKNIYVNMMKEYDKLEAEFSKATATEKQGLLNSEEQATLDKLKSAIQAAKDRERGFLSKVDQVKGQAADVQEKDLRHVIGGFNASAIARALLSSGGPDERTAKASEETNRILKKIERLQSKTSDYKTVYGE